MSTSHNVQQREQKENIRVSKFEHGRHLGEGVEGPADPKNL